MVTVPANRPRRCPPGVPVTDPAYDPNVCSTCLAYEERVRSGTVAVPNGAIAQVVERFHGMEEVQGSSPCSSTFFQALETAAFTLGGLIAGEGSFSIARRRETFADGSPRLRFVFEIALADRDLNLLVALRNALSVGAIRRIAPRSEQWLPTAVLSVTGERNHLRATVPFCDRYLLPSAKRAQFERWRDQLIDYRQRRLLLRPPGRSTCRAAGCDGPVRGRGLRRHHYYLETGW